MTNIEYLYDKYVTDKENLRQIIGVIDNVIV